MVKVPPIIFKGPIPKATDEDEWIKEIQEERLDELTRLIFKTILEGREYPVILFNKVKEILREY